MANKMPASKFVSELAAALDRKDGYIMGATGQNPKKWATSSWWFTQYSGNQRTKALYWREHAARVWDCNGLAEGIYKDYAGVNINTKARYNYASWCGQKGSGIIPASMRVPGAAVFWSDSGAGSIHHVAYLYKPVKDGQPEGDWYLIEARGVLHGVVKTKLLSRKPNYWGWMDKYFDYDAAASPAASALHLGDRPLSNGCEGEDVKELQTALISLGYDCGKWGVDGDFGDATEMAVRVFQLGHGIDPSGTVGAKTFEALAIATAEDSTPTGEDIKTVEISGGNCYVRKQPNKSGEILGVAYNRETFGYAGQTSENGWLLIDYKNQTGWVSGKYAKLKGE